MYGFFTFSKIVKIPIEFEDVAPSQGWSYSKTMHIPYVFLMLLNCDFQTY